MKHIYVLCALLIITSVTYCQRADAGSDKAICKGSRNGVVIGNMPEDPNLCYSWKASPIDPIISNAKTAKITVTPTRTTTYTLTVIGEDFKTVTTDEVTVSVINIDLMLPKSTITLCESIELTTLSFSGFTFDKYKFEIRFSNSLTWYTMQNSASPIHTRTFKVAGQFKIRVTVENSGVTCSSTEKDLEVQFPSSNDIKSNSVLYSKFKTTFDQTKSATSSNSDHCTMEQGFVIKLNTLSCEYETTSQGVRTWAVHPACPTPPNPNPCSPTNPSNTCRPGINFFDAVYKSGTTTIADEPIAPNPLDHSKYIVAIFHTHPPNTYVHKDLARSIGPSCEDNTNMAELVKFLWDYIPSTGTITANCGDTRCQSLTTTCLPGQHPINLDADLYTYGRFRRETPK